MTTPAALHRLLAALLAAAPGLAAGQAQVHDGGTGGGALPWAFAAFAVLALVALFLVVMWLRRPPERPPFNRPRG